MANQLRELLAETPLGSTLIKEKYGVQKEKRESSPKSPKSDAYTEQQNILYNRALFGLTVYSEEEIKKMHHSKRDRIKAVHKRAQMSINTLKQEIVIALSDRLFSTVFPDSYITKELLECPECRTPDPDYICKLSFKTLHINKPLLISRFVSQGILPRDFYQLTDKL